MLFDTPNDTRNHSNKGNTPYPGSPNTTIPQIMRAIGVLTLSIGRVEVLVRFGA